MRIAGLVMAAALAFTAACSGPGSVKEAEAKIATFHDNVDKGNYDAVWLTTTEDPNDQASKAGLVGLLTKVHDQMGKVKESKQSGWKVNVENGVSTTEVTMQTTFENGALEEQFTFQSNGGEMKLSNYHVNQK